MRRPHYPNPSRLLLSIVVASSFTRRLPSPRQCLYTGPRLLTQHVGRPEPFVADTARQRCHLSPRHTSHACRRILIPPPLVWCWRLSWWWAREIWGSHGLGRHRLCRRLPLFAPCVWWHSTSNEEEEAITPFSSFPLRSSTANPDKENELRQICHLCHPRPT